MNASKLKDYAADPAAFRNDLIIEADGRRIVLGAERNSGQNEDRVILSPGSVLSRHHTHLDVAFLLDTWSGLGTVAAPVHRSGWHRRHCKHRAAVHFGRIFNGIVAHTRRINGPVVDIAGSGGGDVPVD